MEDVVDRKKGIDREQAFGSFFTTLFSVPLRTILKTFVKLYQNKSVFPQMSGVEPGLNVTTRVGLPAWVS